MKNIVIILVMLMLASFISAFPTPLPINGRLTGDNAGAQLIEVTNLNTGDIQTFTTTSSGEYLVDWINSPNYYSRGDVFQVKVIACALVSNDCIKTITYQGNENRLTVNFDLNTLITCPSYAPCPPCNCGGGGSGVIIRCTQEEAEKMVKCPEDCLDPGILIQKEDCPEDTSPYYSCKSCCTEKECKSIVDCGKLNSCLEEKKTTLGQILIYITSLLVVGILSFYSGKKLER